MTPRLFKKLSQLSVFILVLVLMSSLPTMAQDNSVTFDGLVSEVTDSTIVVGGVAVDVSNAVLPVNGVTVGMTVTVIGAADGQTIVANVIVLVSTDDVTTEPTPAPETTVEAPETTAEAPPTQAPVVVDGEPLIVIEGPVQAINITSITIFDINIQVDPADEVLTQIRIGDTIRVQGQSSFENNTIIIIAVNITIIETTVIVVNNPGTVYVPVGIPSNCKRTGRGNGRITCKNTNRSSRSSR